MAYEDSDADEASAVLAASAADPISERSFDLEDYVSLLASFQHEIGQVDQHLRTASDEATVERCAAEMTSANNRYVVQSKQACEQLGHRDEDSPAITEEKLHFRHSISSQARQVIDRSEDIRAIDVRSDPDAAKRSLLEVTSHLSHGASRLQQELRDIFKRAEQDSDFASTSEVLEFSADDSRTRATWTS
jgi:hypothetical protein